MTVEPLVARSPLAGWTLDASGVTARELPFRSQRNVRSEEAPQGQALRLGPDEWLVLDSSDGDEAGDVDVSAQRTVIELTGPGVRDVLAHGCAIDLDESVRPVGAVVETLVAQTGVVLVVGAGAILLLVRASFARYLADWLTDAAFNR